MSNPYANPYGQYPQPGYGMPFYSNLGYQPNVQQPMQQMQQPMQQPQRSQNTYDFVNGVEGAKSYRVLPNQAVMLMDSDQPIAYMKQANGMGQASIRYFKLSEVSESEAKGQQPQQPTVEFVTKADFDALAAKVESLIPKAGE